MSAMAGRRASARGYEKGSSDESNEPSLADPKTYFFVASTTEYYSLPTNSAEDKTIYWL
jgi:hypothetical protein